MRQLWMGGSVFALAAVLTPGVVMAAEATPTLKAGDVSAGTSVDEIIVTGRQADTRLKSAVPLLETPQNVQVLSSKLLADQGANLLENALQNVAGVTTGSYSRSYDFYRIRGFDSSGYTYVDGLPRGVAINVELAGLESVEVIKGPSSVLFGAGSPGGLVNLVSKRPTRDRMIDLQASYGSFESYTVMADMAGSLTGDGNVYGRFVANYRDDKSFIDFHPGTKRLYIAPSLTWEPGSDTKITFLASISKDWSNLIPDQPAAGLVYAGPKGYYSRSLYIGDPDNMGKIKQTFYTVGYELDHRFSDSVSLYQNVRYSHLDLAYLNLYQPLSYDPATGIQSQYGDDFFETRDIYSVDTGLNIDFSTGSISHKLTVGAEYEGKRNPTRLGLGFSPPILFDLYNPDYSVFQTQPRSWSTTNTKSDGFGFYVQDTAKITDALSLTLGGRFDTVKISDTNSSADYSKFTPRAGLTYAFRPGVAGYLSYSRSFNPQPGFFDLSGDPVPPETGEAYEAGVKMALLDGRVNSTLAIFQITRANVATAIPSSPGVYAVTGSQRSQGFEFDGQFKLAPGWELVTSYAYTKAVVRADNTAPIGDTVIGAPRHKASLWMRYVVQDGALKGLGFSFGGSAYSSQEGSLPNTYKIPAYAVANANISYKTGPYTVQLNVNNLFDKDYIAGATGDLFVVGGDPRTWRLTFGWSY